MYYLEDTSDLQVASDLSAATQLGQDHPADYCPDPGLVKAVNVALVLNKPLLLTGDPGTGKTQLAFSVAWQLAARRKLNVRSPRVERFEAKSTSVARDLFYTFDTLRRFHAANTGGSQEGRDYLAYNALGRAVLRALPRDKVEHYVNAEFEHDGPTRSVVLIDEIDKAPRDFPNDLLNEIEQMFFRIPELDNKRIGGSDQIAKEHWPIVFITSNSEKNLPDPFLRRCVYYHIPFPDQTALARILVKRLERLEINSALLAGALEFFYHLRKDQRTRRRISPAELIQWLSYMLSRGASSGETLKAAAEMAQEGLCAMVKDPEDQQRIRAELTSFLARA